MFYVHDGKSPVELSEDPMSVGSKEWILFVLGGFLRVGETVSDYSATVVGGTLAAEATLIGTYTDACGATYTDVYGVQVEAGAGYSKITVVFTFSTTTTGDVDIGHTDIQRTVYIPVRVL